MQHFYKEAAILFNQQDKKCVSAPESKNNNNTKNKKFQNRTL